MRKRIQITLKIWLILIGAIEGQKREEGFHTVYVQNTVSIKTKLNAVGERTSVTVMVKKRYHPYFVQN